MSFAPASEVPERGLHLIDYVLVSTDGRVLLEKRLQPDFLAGKWSLPWELLDYGEHPDSSVRRIIHEHLGVGLKADSLLSILSYTKAHEMIPALPPHWDLCFIHEVELAGEPRFDTELISEIDYRALDELPSDFPPFQRYLLSQTIVS